MRVEKNICILILIIISLSSCNPNQTENYQVTCKESETKGEGEPFPSETIKECKLKDFVTIKRGTPDDKGMFSYDYELYKDIGGKNKRIVNTDMFNEKVGELVNLIKDSLDKQIKDYSTEPNGKSCFEEIDLKKLTINDLGIEFETGKVVFHLTGLYVSCLYEFDLNVSVNFKLIKEYIISSPNTEENTTKSEENPKESTESVEFSDGKLIIKYNGNTLVVSRPYAITHFCSANFTPLRIGNYSDWRLPTPEELKLIYKYRESLGLNTNINMNSYDVSELLGKGQSNPVKEIWSSEYMEDRTTKTEKEYRRTSVDGGDYYDRKTEKIFYNVTTLNIITGEIKIHNGCECGAYGDHGIWIPVRNK